jgi:PAS domain S-box-containing protein
MIFSIRVILNKEKMGKQFEETKIDKPHYPIIQDSLVLSVDKNGRINKFNPECEKVFGYRKNEVLNRFVTDFFIPSRYLDQWRYLFEYSKTNKLVDDFKIPFLTKSGEEIIVYWSNFPVKNDKGDLIDVGFVGNMILPIEENKTLFEYPKYEHDELNFAKLSKEDKVDDYLTKVIRKMKSKNEDLLIKNKDLEKELKYYKKSLENYKELQGELKKSDIQLISDMNSFSKFFVGKKRRLEYENMMFDFDQRKKELNKLESKLRNEKIKINEKMNDFRLWREKLELLNNKLEEKWNELVNRENLIIKNPSYSINQNNIMESENKDLKYNYEIFDQIKDSAVIIQRGILRYVNSAFVNLTGYSVDEIVDKSFFDFIVPEGFLNVEKFFLSRLKGEDISTYETVILTKDNNKISIEVNTKPTFFNGEKAEIAIVKILKNDKK